MDTSYKKSNFGGAFFFLSKEQRGKLAAIYAFCREADDTVDENYPDAPARLAALRAKVPALAAQLNIPAQYFMDLLDGMESDLRPQVTFADRPALEWYMYRAAAVVGLMCIEVFGYTNPRAKDYAVQLGYAVQQTNILRDVEDDAKINRFYIPQSEQGPNARALQIAAAQKYYAAAAALLPKEDFKTLLPARAMGNIYRAILQKTQKASCPQGGKKLKLSKLQKIFILLKTFLERP